MQMNRLVNYSIIFIALVLLAIVFKTFQAVLRPLAIAALFLFIVTPLARYSKKKRIPVWLTFSGLFIILVLILSVVGSFMTVENMDLKSEIPRYKEKIEQSSSGILALGSKLGFGTENFTPDKLGQLVAKSAAMAIGAMRTILSEMLLATILLMFIIQSYPSIIRMLDNRFGQEEVERFQTTVQKIEGDVIAYFSTKAAMSLGTAIISGIVLFLFNAEFIYFSLLIIFMLNFIPIIGSLVAVGIVMILYVLAIGLSAKAIWLFVLLMASQVLFGSILEPKIAGDRLKISPILIIFSLYLWGWIWGVVGMLLSVPLAIFIKILITHVGAMKTDNQDAVVQS